MSPAQSQESLLHELPHRTETPSSVHKRSPKVDHTIVIGVCLYICDLQSFLCHKYSCLTVQLSQKYISQNLPLKHLVPYHMYPYVCTIPHVVGCLLMQFSFQ